MPRPPCFKLNSHARLNFVATLRGWQNTFNTTSQFAQRRLDRFAYGRGISMPERMLRMPAAKVILEFAQGSPADCGSAECGTIPSLWLDDPRVHDPVRGAACFFLRNEIALCYTIASTAREVGGRGSCPETQCPGGVRGVSFHRRDPARCILKGTTTKIFPPNCRSRMKTAKRFRHRREILSGVRISGNRNRSSAVGKAARFPTSSDF